MNTTTREAHVAIVGAGTMGAAFAAVFSLAGHRVSLVDVDESALATAVERAEVIAGEWQGRDSADIVRARVESVSTLDAAVEGADLVLEAATEDLALKQKLFGELDSICQPTTILCSNTSALPIAEVMAQVDRQDRALGTHWFNPPHLVPAVEVIRGPGTSDETVERVMSMLRDLGKEPVQIADLPGFLANRLQMALAKEAILCLAEGVASAEDIDRLFSSSIGFRLAAVGPLGIADFAGLDVYLEVFETLAGGVSERFRPPQLLYDLVAQGKLGAKTGDGFLNYGNGRADLIALRDRRLLALLRLKSSPEWRADSEGANTAPPRSLILADIDSVAVVLDDVRAGQEVALPNHHSVTALSDVPAGHKLCIRDVNEGEPLLKYGEPIGIASKDIAVGEHVHVHNLASTRAGGSRSD